MKSNETSSMETSAVETTMPPAPLGRRSFFLWVTALFGSVATALLAIPGVRYFIPNFAHPIDWVNLGKVTTFETDETRFVTFDNPIREPWDGQAAHTGVYVRYEGKTDKDEHRFLVLSVNCAHLGCPVSWFPQSGLFMCPCHGGVYYSNGERASGPPPRGMFHCVWRVKEGNLEIQAPHYPSLQDTLDGSGEARVASAPCPSTHCGAPSESSSA